MKFKIARASYMLGSIAFLEPWHTTLAQFSKLAGDISNEKRKGDFFIRCAISENDYENLSETASLLIINANRRISNGRVVSGAPDPSDINQALYNCEIVHAIFSCHSNGMSKDELLENNIDSDGAFLDKYFRYKIIIPIKYKKEHLPIILKYIFSILHNHALIVVDEQENYAWHRRCYLPLINDDKKKYFKNIYEGKEYESKAKELKIEVVVKHFNNLNHDYEFKEIIWKNLIGEWIKGSIDWSMHSSTIYLPDRTLFSISEVLTEVLNIEPEKHNTSLEMFVANILKELGFNKVRIQKNLKREVLWKK